MIKWFKQNWRKILIKLVPHLMAHLRVWIVENGYFKPIEDEFNLLSQEYRKQQTPIDAAWKKDRGY